MQQKIQQALTDSPLSNAILSALEEQEWKGFLPAEKVWSICDEFKLTPVQLGLALLPVAACFKLTDYSGNPRVYVHDLGNKDNKYECKDFDEWLAEEIKSAKEY